MTTRISIPAGAVTTTRREEPVYDLGQKVKAALAAGVFAGMGVLLLLWTLVLVGLGVGVKAPWQVWAACPLIAAALGVGVACWLGYEWVVNVASRPWRLEDEERGRLRQLEDEERARLAAAVHAAKRGVVEGEDDDGNPATLNDAQRLHLVGLEIMDRFYRQGQPVTREAMCEEGLCTQPQWNLANRAMLAVGLKVKKRMREDLGFPEAWQLWRSSVQVDDKYVWIVDARGNRKVLEHLS